MANTILHIDSSARFEGSQSRALSAQVVETLTTAETRVIRRDLAISAPPPVEEAWVQANFTPDAQRTAAQRDALAGSDTLVDELHQAETLVIGLPIYNFGVPAVFKAWVDQIARARKTFEYTESGPRGLLHGKRAILVITSGGTEIDTDLDFATPYVRHVLGFVGITDVTVIAADKLMLNADAALEAAASANDRLAA